jgi:hypothetical protein
MNDPLVDVPDDVFQRALAVVASYLLTTLGRDPTEQEVITSLTSVGIRLSMVTDDMAKTAGLDHPQIIRTAFRAAERWRAAQQNDRINN